MGLGNNRDYKTSERRAFKNLAKHAKLMKELIAHGMTREQASTYALREMEEDGWARIDSLLQICPKSDLPTK
jgi:hypothetical protein